ncbi:Crp/Fnr family transcriptional regulator [Crenalkalicoccus roseus]|uniref:Crp/Fnr family transcriptional regulator n=1 Tax=Crenalkalicoccus roseus TaxID=1485588 RepID=UPI0010807AFD|nr:Crp/Fnr family transcriptional regulator [Crenalkalicoccus roseus]
MSTIAPDRLAALPFFEGAEPGLLARFERQAAWRSYGPGDVVVDFDDPSTEVHLIASGAVRVLVRSPAGRELILNDLVAGDLIGELAAIDGAPRSANVTALVRSRLCALPAAAFLEILCASPPVCLRLLRRLAAKLRLQTARALERETLSVRLRLCAELLRLSRGRAAGQGEGERVVSPPPPQHEIAARIGARREAVSREMAELERQGLLARTAGAILIPRPAALRALVEAGLRDDPEA